MTKDSIRIGTIYNLNADYSNNYTLAIITYDTKTQETVVWLKSNWNSSYDRTERFKHLEPLTIVKRYQA